MIDPGWTAPVSDAYRRGDFVEAVTLVTPKAAAGFDAAQTMFGQMCLNGQGVQRSPQQALIWLSRAAVQGEGQAACILGALYATGKVVPVDYKAAAKWLRIAAHQQNSAAAFSLAELYQKGLGVERGASKALAWTSAAVALCGESCGDHMATYVAARDDLAATLSKERVRR